jgi:hypothetical protein
MDNTLNNNAILPAKSTFSIQCDERMNIFDKLERPGRK